MSTKRKVVIFYPHIGEYGGIERNIIALSIEALNKGYTPVLLCFYDHIHMHTYVEGLEVIVLGDHWSPFKKGAMVSAWFKKNAQTFEGLPLFFGGKAGFYAALAKVNPYALHYTDPPSLVKDVTSSALKKTFMYPRKLVSDYILTQGVVHAQMLITMTKRNAVELESVYGKKFEVVYQGGVPISTAINTSQRCNTSTLRLFSICRLNASKKLHWIIEAGKYIKTTTVFAANFTALEIVIAGKGPALEELKNKAEALEMQHEVSFPGFVSSEELENEYSKADLFMVPGIQGYGLPVLEALYRHVPVILNRESRISEILENNSWVSISNDTSTSYTKALENYLQKMKQEYPLQVDLLTLPTETQWADALGKTCGWWNN